MSKNNQFSVLCPELIKNCPEKERNYPEENQAKIKKCLPRKENLPSTLSSVNAFQLKNVMYVQVKC